jgi:DNA repair protein RadC
MFSDTYTAIDKPARRLREVGSDSLNTAELLAVALRINKAEAANALAAAYAEAGAVNRISRERVLAIPGLGEGYADSLAAIAELVSREMRSYGREERSAVHSPDEVADLVRYDMAALDHEEFWVIMLDTRNGVIGIHHLYKGCLNMSNVRIAEVFKAAIAANAATIICAHNHPSGDPAPSPEDISLTHALVQAGKLMDIDVLDHVVIGNSSYVSLKQRGLGF